MIIEIPDDNSIVKWKKNDKDDWKSAEISDLIKTYEKKPQGDCISREALKEDFDVAFFYDEDDYKKALRIIDNASTVEMNALPKIHYDRGFIAGYEKSKAERPQGTWLKSGNGKTTFFCSECGREIDTKPFTRPDNFPFCHCGADMRGDTE